jgi:hypothetical protein
MSGETEAEQSGLTVDTTTYALRDRIAAVDRVLNQRIDDLIMLLNERKDNQDKSVREALASINERLKMMNELRGTIDDQARTFMPRNEYNTAHNALVERVGDLSSRMDRSEGSGVGKAQLWGYLIAVVAALGTIVIVTNVLISR